MGAEGWGAWTLNMTRIKVNNSGKSQTRASFTFCRMTKLKEKLKKKRKEEEANERKTKTKKKRQKLESQMCCWMVSTTTSTRRVCNMVLHVSQHAKEYTSNANKICCTRYARASQAPAPICAQKIIKMTRLHLLRKYFYLKETKHK